MAMTAARKKWLCVLLAFAGTQGLRAASVAEPLSVRDDTGAEVRLPDRSCRIVSLAPGTTAMLYAVGAGSCLIGTIAHSKEPDEAARVPVIGDAETLDFEQL